MNSLASAENPTEEQLRAALKASEELEKRKTAEARAEAALLAERASHDYALAVEEGKAAMAEWEACKQIADAADRMLGQQRRDRFPQRG